MVPSLFIRTSSNLEYMVVVVALKKNTLIWPQQARCVDVALRDMV